MKITLLAASLAALSFASADLALAQGKGNGGGEGKGHAEQGGPGKGGGQEKGGGKPDRMEGRGPQARGNERRPEAKAEAKAEAREMRADNRGRDDRAANVRVERADPRPDRAPDRAVALRDDRRGGDDRSDRIFFRVADRGLIAGCPPGLAKKNNGCLPPGQAKKLDMAPSRYDTVWDRWNDDYDYRYDSGYLYRTTPQGGLLGYLPVLGGALGLGQVWPAQYSYDPVPTYYSDYYGLSDRYQYRYADGALFGLDPQTQTISRVAALLTGQDWTIGQPMPPGYDIYNVPYDYRSRYMDGPQSLYRYSDGYVYQVDPTTRLVQAAIQLLT